MNVSSCLHLLLPGLTRVIGGRGDFAYPQQRLGLIMLATQSDIKPRRIQQITISIWAWASRTQRRCICQSERPGYVLFNIILAERISLNI